MESWDVIIPRPAKAEPLAGVLKVESLGSVTAQAGLARFKKSLIADASAMGVDLTGKGTPVRLVLSPEIKVESFVMTVDAKGVTVAGGDPAGVFYGVGAFVQYLCTAVARGLRGAVLPCCRIEDSPRFAYRGLMLDSARHFQSVAVIKRVLALMSELRLNVFHWHLCDSQGFRTESKLFPELNTLGTMAPGFYTAEDIAGIRAFAAERFITIIPEIEMPGHSEGLLALHPELCCDPENPGREFCLAKKNVRVFLKKLIAEFAGLFPDSKIIHLGGDEAETAHWEKCPECRKLLKKKGCTSFRQLENDFMNDCAAYVRSLGLTPVTWFTESVMEPSTIIQAWRSIHELKETCKHGNRMIFSVHDQLYLDYPATPAEPFENWMLTLPESGVYTAEPYAAWEEEIGDLLLGPECCLWTETVPEHRVIPKLLPRLCAFAETAWTPSCRRTWFNYTCRRETLTACGWFDLKV